MSEADPRDRSHIPALTPEQKQLAEQAGDWAGGNRSLLECQAGQPVPKWREAK